MILSFFKFVDVADQIKIIHQISVSVIKKVRLPREPSKSVPFNWHAQEAQVGEPEASLSRSSPPNILDLPVSVPIDRR